MKLISKLSFCNLVMAAGILVGAPAQATLDLSQDPLFLVAPVKPALLMAIDDSGSMDFEVIFPTNDGALWWNTNASRRSFTGQGVSSDGNSDVNAPGVPNFNAQGGANNTWQKFTYLFPNGQDGGNGHRRTLGDGNNDHFAIPPIPAYAYARSSAFNGIYFDPSENYPVPPSVGSATFSDADPEAALSDWTRGTSTFNLTAPLRSTADNWVFRMYRGMTVPAGAVVRQAQSNTCEPFDDDDWEDWTEVTVNTPIEEDNCALAVEYYPATFWLPQGTSLPSGFGFSGTPLTGGLAPDGSAMLGYEIKEANFASIAAYQNAIQNFANWFQYYRKRNLSTRSAIGRAFAETTFLRSGFFTINNRVNVTMRDLGDATDRQAFFDWHYNLRGSGGTPNKQAVHHMGNQFRRAGSDAPVLLACQRNFGMLFTDGYANAWDGAGVGNTDGALPPPLGDNVANTMADIAYYHYTNNLRPPPAMAAGQVPVPTRCNQPDPPPWLNCNPDPHMQFYGVTLNTPGLIFGVDQAATEDPWNNPPDWPNTFPNRHPSAVDDLWHATLNTRGELFSTTRPSELVEALSSVLSQIASSILPSGVSATSTRLDADANIFLANLDSTAWSGNLEARNALTQDTIWSAEDELPDPVDRVIMTSVGGAEIPFDLTLPFDVRENIFGQGHDGAVADQVIRYLRGERAGLEQSMGGPFRDRDGRIGDIVNSAPAYSGTGNEGWARLTAAQGGGASGAGSYGAYVDGTKASRPALVLVGANDGMLHVFDAATGVERYAYIPEAVQHKLAALANPEYSHQFYVDGQITVRDVRIGGNWRTVAVVTLGAGGRGIFALDITNPNEISLLWEINSDDLPGLGYTFGEPIITRLGSGEWVTIFGNGYNSNDTRARLYVASIDNGNIVQTIDLGNSTGNGLSGAAALLDPVSRARISRVYAGDLLGNMWRVDFDDGGTGSVAYNQGLFNDPNGRAITATPTLAANPDGGLMVFYGSGKLLEPNDRLASDFQTDRLYALIDRGSRINNISQLGAASMSLDAGERVIDAANVGNGGWYLDLQIGSPSGERVLTRPQVVFGQLVFSTFEPLSDPCATGGVNRVFVLDALSGGGNLPTCPGCGVIDVGEGAPIDPTVFINPPTGPGGDDPTPPPPGTVDPDDPDGPEPVPAPPVGADPQDWCSDQVIFNPSTGEFIVVGKICDGRQSWRQAR